MSVLNLNEQPKSSLLRRQRRREKSRDAARFRRHKESDTFDEICNNIPVPHDAINHLDKSAVMRLLISFIKLRQALNGKSTTYDFPVIKQEFIEELNLVSAKDHVNALNAFILILSSDLDILYVSDNVKQYLGLSKLDLIGQSILAYAHEGDHDDVRGCFSQEGSSQQKNFFLRLKSTLTISGKSINLKSASYKFNSTCKGCILKFLESAVHIAICTRENTSVMRCSGIVKPTTDTSYFVAHVEPIPHPANIQLLMDSKTFVTQHSPDMKFTYCDERFAKLLNFHNSDLLNHSFFDFCHAADVKEVGEFFHKLFRLNQVETGQYRILSKAGGYHRLVTQATVITNQKNRKPQCVVCVHYMVSDLVQGDVILSSEQLRHAEAILSGSVSSFSLEAQEMDGIEDSDVTSKLLSQLSEAETSSSGADDCSVARLTFTEMDESENVFTDDMYHNAPSIGDPWSYSANNEPVTGKIDDLFPDVVLDNSMQGSPSINSEPTIMTSPTSSFARSSITFGQSTPCGSLSPCDSAYYGSPLHGSEPTLRHAQADHVVNIGHLAQSSRNSSIFSPAAYQPVAVPRDKYNGHMRNLKRGIVESACDDNAMNEWPRNKKQVLSRINPEAAKRQCFDSNTIVPPCEVQSQPVKTFSYSDLMKTPSVLMCPGDGFGLNDTSLLGGASLLLQPEMNFQRNENRRIVNDRSTSLLPQLSLHDCEVNAPLLLDGRDVLPLAADCVHALDAES